MTAKKAPKNGSSQKGMQSALKKFARLMEQDKIKA
jgi:hypothetical protein